MEVLVLEEKEDKRSVWNQGIKDKLFGEMVRKPVLLEERKKMRIELIEIPCTARWYTDALINLTMMCSFLLVTQLDTRKKSRNKMESSFILNKSLTSLLSTFRNLTPNLQKKKKKEDRKNSAQKERTRFLLVWE